MILHFISSPRIIASHDLSFSFDLFHSNSFSHHAGPALDTDGTIGGSKYSYTCAYQCPGGQSSNGGFSESDCTDCQAGTSSGFRSCEPCEAGKYSGKASASCTACPAGKEVANAATGDESVACVEKEEEVIDSSAAPFSASPIRITLALCIILAFSSFM